MSQRINRTKEVDLNSINLTKNRLNPKDIQRFMCKIVKTDNCWNWIGTIQKDDYGQFWLKGKKFLAHRISYELFREIIPTDKELDHLCRNRLCVNPDHLEAVTHKENVNRGDLRNNHHQLLKTHCPKGHPYLGDNLYVQPDGRRRCLACHRVINKNYRIRQSLK